MHVHHRTEVISGIKTPKIPDLDLLNVWVVWHKRLIGLLIVLNMVGNHPIMCYDGFGRRFKCGQVVHYIRECPNNKQGNRGTKVQYS